MTRDILIVRNGDHYRLLHGHLRLVSALSAGGAIRVDVREEGEVRIVRAPDGLLVEKGSQRLPLCRNV